MDRGIFNSPFAILTGKVFFTSTEAFNAVLTGTFKLPSIGIFVSNLAFKGICRFSLIPCVLGHQILNEPFAQAGH